MDSRDLRNLAEAWESITTSETETEQLDERMGRISPAAQRAAAKARRLAASQAEAEFKAGGGYAKQAETRVRGAGRSGRGAGYKPGMSRAEVIALGRKNIAAQEARDRAAQNRALPASGPDPARETLASRPTTPVKPVASDTAPAKPATAPADAVKPKRPSIADELRSLRAMRAASVMRQQGKKIDGRIPTGADVQAASKTLQDLKKGSQYLKQDADLFDIVKGHLMSEGATEEEALKRMASMTEEERMSILEKE